MLEPGYVFHDLSKIPLTGTVYFQHIFGRWTTSRSIMLPSLSVHGEEGNNLDSLKINNSGRSVICVVDLFQKL